MDGITAVPESHWVRKSLQFLPERWRKTEKTMFHTVLLCKNSLNNRLRNFFSRCVVLSQVGESEKEDQTGHLESTNEGTGRCLLSEWDSCMFHKIVRSLI